MRSIFISVFFATMCDSPAPPSTYDAGEASCDEAWAAIEGCPEFDMRGPDEQPDSGDEVPWVVWCEEFQASGIEKINTACLAQSADCEAAAECLLN